MASTDPEENLRQAVDKALKTMSETEVRKIVEQELNSRRS
jgi:hypothetical protein